MVKAKIMESFCGVNMILQNAATTVCKVSEGKKNNKLIFQILCRETSHCMNAMELNRFGFVFNVFYFQKILIEK